MVERLEHTGSQSRTRSSTVSSVMCGSSFDVQSEFDEPISN